MHDTFEQAEFTERADFLEEADLLKWNVENDHFIDIQKKLIMKGAKLIIGPRGTGKTHQMKLVFQRCSNDKTLPLPIYVSFSKYYFLEPFLFKSPNAIKIFHSWVLCKILVGCYDTLKSFELTLFDQETSLPFPQKKIENFISRAEKGVVDNSNEIFLKITYQLVNSFIEKLIYVSRRKRAILLLDDAALTLTHDYMIEFFDIFRSLHTTNISPKASVYPGTTEYGPRFHLGQDAEQVEMWLNVEEPDYSKFMNKLILKRFPNLQQDLSDDVLELLKYAAFGIPRAFINLLRSYIQNENSRLQTKINSTINERAKLLKDEYMSLSKKLPQYKSIINTGFLLLNEIIVTITHENNKLTDKKNIQIGLTDDYNLQHSRMLKFLIEAGLLYELEKVHHGKDRTYSRFIPHMLLLINNRAFSSTSKGFNIKEIVNFIKREQSKHPIRRSLSSLLGSDNLLNIKLDLPSCKNCGANRLTEDQKFCHNCGSELVGQSIFEKCMNITIDELPLSEWQKEKILKETNIRTVKDFLSTADPATELRKATLIGKKRSEKIYQTVKLHVEEFLE